MMETKFGQFILFRVPELLWSWSQDPTKEIWSNYTNSLIPYAVHKSYVTRDHKFDGVDWEPIYATWSTLQDPSRQDVESSGQRQIYKTYRTFAEADEAAKELIAK